MDNFYLDLNNELNHNNDVICQFNIDNDFLYINLNYVLLRKFFGEKSSLSEIIFMMIIERVMEFSNGSSYYLPKSTDELLGDLNNICVEDSYSLNHNLVNILKVTSGMYKSPFYDLARRLEDEILEGEIKVKKTEFSSELILSDSEYGMEIDLRLPSSTVRQMTPFIVYLKYFLQQGDTLIIENPENHLHPETS